MLLTKEFLDANVVGMYDSYSNKNLNKFHALLDNTDVRETYNGFCGIRDDLVVTIRANDKTLLKTKQILAIIRSSIQIKHLSSEHISQTLELFKVSTPHFTDAQIEPAIDMISNMINVSETKYILPTIHPSHICVMKIQLQNNVVSYLTKHIITKSGILYDDEFIGL